jgi:hypothetical protein
MKQEKLIVEMQREIDKNMKTYTIIREYLGGTYVSQYLASTPQEAFLIAIDENIKNKELIDFNKDVLKEIHFWLEEIGLVTLSGLNNIWYFSFTYKKKSYHSHIVETVVFSNAKGN